MASPFESSQHVTVRPLGTVRGASNGYLEYLPPGYGDNVARPLLLFLHGSPENGNGSERSLPSLFQTGIPRLISDDAWPADRPFVVLVPQHDRRTGGLCFDAGEVDEMIRFAIANYVVDPARIYLTGVSCGAIGAWRYLAEHADEYVSAAVLIAGDGRGVNCDVGRVAIWAFHGVADQRVDPAGSIEPIATLRACTGPPAVDARLNVYPGMGHAMWEPVYSGELNVDIYAWLLSHSHA